LHCDDRDAVTRIWSSCVATGSPFEVQARLRRPDGGYRWVYSVAQPGRDSQARVTCWYGLLVDIDDRKNIEEALRTTEAKLSRATQIATVGELSASIAHEINQPLAAVVASAHACVRFLSATPPAIAKSMEAAQSIVRDGKEAGEVVRRIRALFKKTLAAKVPLNLNEIISEVLQLLSGEITRRGVIVEIDFEKQLPLEFGGPPGPGRNSGLWDWDRGDKQGVRRLLHDQSERNGYGIGDLSIDRRSSRGSSVVRVC